MIIEINEKYLNKVFKRAIVADIGWQQTLKHAEECGYGMAISFHCRTESHCHHNSCGANFVKDCDYPNCICHIRKVIVKFPGEIDKKG